MFCVSMLAALATIVSSESAQIVGSSTVAPFADIVANRVNRSDDFSVIIERTGSNAGLKAFCASGDPAVAPVVMASRPMEPDERQTCSEALGAGIEEHVLGINGVALVNYRGGVLAGASFSVESLFLALAEKVPAGTGDCRLVDNPASLWSDVDPELPDAPITVLGPGISSGTYSTFVDLALVKGAQANQCMLELDEAEPGLLKRTAKAIREDLWTDAGENDIELVAQLHEAKDHLGVIGYASAKRFGRHLVYVDVDGVQLNNESLVTGYYPLAGKLYLYSNQSAVAANPSAKAFLDAFTSAEAIGPAGYLTERGLISLGE